MAEAKKGPALQGFLQAMHPQKLRGWAFLPADPNAHLRIEVRVDGALVAQTVASMQFGDLERARIGRGDHGFLLHLETTLPVETPERVEVLAVAADGTRRALELSAGARARSITAAEDAPPPPTPTPTPTPTPPPPPSRPSLSAAPAAPRFNATDATQRPVFVLGSARSGTTAMMQALRASGRFAGYNEGHLLPLIARLETTISNHYARAKRDAAPGMNTLVAHIPAQTVTDAMQSGFVEILRAAFPTGFWLDKTPGPDMIKASTLMWRIWPQARFIFMHRRPVDNIESRRRKFPTISFRDHCRLWADSMMSWHEIRDELAEVSLEVDQARLATDPVAVAAEVAELLNLTEREADRLLAAFRTDRPQQTGPDIAAIADLARVDWTSEQRAAFHEICDGPMRLFGYGDDSMPGGQATAGEAGPASARPSLRNPASC